MIKPFTLLTLSTFLPLSAQTATSTLQLAGDDVLTVQVSGMAFNISAADSDTTTVTGELQAELTINETTNRVTNISFVDGDLAFTDMDFELVFRAGIIPFGEQNVDTLDVRGTALTTDEDTSVAANNQFSAAAHSVRLDSGLVDSSGSLGDFDRDLEDEPLEAEGNGQGTITLTETASGLNGTLYDVSLVLPVNGEDEFNDPNNIGTGRISISGSVNATGQTGVFTDDFTAFMVQRNPDLIDTELSRTGDADGDGIQDGLAFALNLPLDANPADDLLRIDRNRALRITLADEGTNRDVRIMASETLAPGSFQEIDKLDAGRTGEALIINASSAEKRFFRLEVATPAS